MALSRCVAVVCLMGCVVVAYADSFLSPELEQAIQVDVADSGSAVTSKVIPENTSVVYSPSVMANEVSVVSTTSPTAKPESNVYKSDSIVERTVDMGKDGVVSSPDSTSRQDSRSLLAESPIPLSLQKALQSAMRSHPEILSAKADSSAAQSQVLAGNYRWFPTFQLSTNGGQASPFGAGTRSANISVQQRLWDAGRVDSDFAVNKGQAASTLSTEEVTLQSIGIRVANAYFGVMRARDQKKIATDNVAEHTRLFGIISNRRFGGLGTSSDVSLARSRLQQAKATDVLWRAEVSRSEATYRALVNQSSPQEMTELGEWQINGGLQIVLDAAKQYAPQLKKLANDLQTVQAALEGQKALLYPTLSARMDHINYLGSADNPAYVNTTRFIVAFDWQNDIILSQRFRIEAASQKVESARYAIESAERQLVENVTGYWQDYLAAIKRYEELKKYEHSAEETLELFQRQFTLGRRSWPEVMNALQDLFGARNQQTDAKYQIMSARMRIAFVDGELESYVQSQLSKMRADTFSLFP